MGVLKFVELCQQRSGRERGFAAQRSQHIGMAQQIGDGAVGGVAAQIEQKLDQAAERMIAERRFLRIENRDASGGKMVGQKWRDAAIRHADSDVGNGEVCRLGGAFGDDARGLRGRIGGGQEIACFVGNVERAGVPEFRFRSAPGIKLRGRVGRRMHQQFDVEARSQLRQCAG